MWIVSWNVKGLRSPHKRMMVLQHLKWLKTDIALLQETHLEDKGLFRLQRLWVGKTHGSSACHNKAVVIMLIHKSLTCDVSQHQSDDEGRWSKVTQLQAYFATTRIVGGDFNWTVLKTGVARLLDPSLLDKETSPSQPLLPPQVFQMPGGYSIQRGENLPITPILIIPGKDWLHPTLTSLAIQDRNRWYRWYGDIWSLHNSPTNDRSHSTGHWLLVEIPYYLAKDDEFRTLLHGWWLEFSTTNNSHVTTPGLYLETAKAVLKGPNYVLCG